MKRTLTSKLIIILIPFLMGFTEDGCDFLNLLFILGNPNPTEIESTPNDEAVGTNFEPISVYDYGVIFSPRWPPREEDLKIVLKDKNNLNDITETGVPLIGNIIVGDNGTLIRLTPDYSVIHLENPAGLYNLNAITDPVASVGGPIEATIYAVGDSGIVIKSSDTGLTWEWLTFPSSSNLSDVCIQYVDNGSEEDTIIYVTGDYYTALKSQDVGETWDPVVPEGGEKQIPDGNSRLGTESRSPIQEKLNKTLSPEYNNSYSKIYFYNDSIGYIAGPHGFILKTINGGLDWTGKFAQGFEQVTDLFFISPDSGVAVGTNGIARFTTDGGDTWFEDTTVTNYLAGRTIKRIIPYGDRYGTILGEGGLDVFIAPDSTYLDSLVVTSIKERLPLPDEFMLYQNYPNPFNPSTTIKYTITSSPLVKGRNEVGFVTLKIYDILGREIATLVNEIKQPGNYEVQFRGVNPLNGASLSSGVYFYRLSVNGFSKTKKFVLLR